MLCMQECISRDGWYRVVVVVIIIMCDDDYVRRIAFMFVIYIHTQNYHVHDPSFSSVHFKHKKSRLRLIDR